MKAKVVLRPGGQAIEVEANESILDAALRHGLNLPHSCKSASCLSCQARVISGEISYPHGRPPVLELGGIGSDMALLCQAHALGDVVVEARPIQIDERIQVKRLPCRIERMEHLAEDVMALYLKLPTVEPFFFLAGQYVDILLDGGRRRGFSIASPPEDGCRIVLHVRRVPGGEFTEHVFTELEVKSLLRIEGPFGGFFMREDSDRPLILMAGGTGFAPLKSIILDAANRGIMRPMHLYWGARTSPDLYQAALAERWVRELHEFQFTPVLSEPERDTQWSGRTGWVHEAVLEDYSDLSGYDVYMSGPPPMVDAARDEFSAHGLPGEQLYFDSFEFSADTLRKINRDD